MREDTKLTSAHKALILKVNQDTGNWSERAKKKLQHMIKFHAEYHCLFGERSSVKNIMKRRICNMNPPCQKWSVRRRCKMPN